MRDPNGAPIEGASIEVSAGTTARTNAKGAFQLWTPAVDTVTISIRRLGFAQIEALLSARNKQWDTVVVEMEHTSQRLSGVNITEEKTRGALALRTLPERAKVGMGQFVLRDEIVARGSSRTSDVLQLKRGVKIVRLGPGRFGIRFVQYSHRGNSCAPDFWIDGMRAKGMEIDDIPSVDVEAIELYESAATVPFEFTPLGTNMGCGTVVVWTRVPNKPDRPQKPH